MIDQSYQFSDIKTLFLARFAAFKNIANNEVTSWGDPDILAIRSDNLLNAIVYKVNYKTNGVDQLLHAIAFFQEEGEFYKFSHEYDLSKLYEKYCQSLSSFHPLIRQLGDSVLHGQAKKVEDFTDSGIAKQLEVMQKTLVLTGGVGIAANQCAQIKEPYQLILVGVDYHNPEHVVKALSRYPYTLFPPMQVFVNPAIVAMSNEFDLFSEGCLSVKGRLRGLVMRPKSLTIRYQDLNDSEKIGDFSGIDARVMLHELDHIINGIVYIERIINDLTKDQCVLLLDVIETIQQTSSDSMNNPFASPLLLFKRGQDGEVTFDLQEAKEYFQALQKDVLDEIYVLLHKRQDRSKARIY